MAIIEIDMYKFKQFDATIVSSIDLIMSYTKHCAIDSYVHLLSLRS